MRSIHYNLSITNFLVMSKIREEIVTNLQAVAKELETLQKTTQYIGKAKGETERAIKLAQKTQKSN